MAGLLPRLGALARATLAGRGRAGRASAPRSPGDPGRVPPRPAAEDPASEDPAAEDPAGWTWAPQSDGRPDPGEVVWAWVPYDEQDGRGKDRPVLVVARDGEELLALVMSSRDHDHDAADEARWGRRWMDVGAGPWDARRRPSEVRLDRVVRLRADAVRREGAVLDRDVFAQVVTAVRARQG